MKLIILIALVSTNLLADVKVTVTDYKNRVSCGNGCRYKTQAEADAWIADNIANDSWGKKARWVNSIDIPDTSVCIEKKDIIPETGEQYEMCKLDKEYTIVITDITAEVQAEKDAKLARKQERKELKALKDTINSSDLPNWHKKLLKHIIKEIRD